MNLSTLLKQIQAIKDQYGDLDIDLVMITSPNDPQAIYWGKLTRLEVGARIEAEERRVLNLVSEDWGE